ncbi:hypothetical protein FHT21_000051 [Pedobacter sp. SG908]|nr:hypothetical protein [Pedobacter sp. SG908]
MVHHKLPVIQKQGHSADNNFVSDGEILVFDFGISFEGRIGEGICRGFLEY